MIKVLKFGGTSVGSAGNMKKVAEIIRHEGATITVLSAMSGTTDALVRIVSLAAQGNTKEAENILNSLHEKYATCIAELLTDKRAEAETLLEQMERRIRQEIVLFKEYISERLIISQGELLTSALFTLYLQECNDRTQLLHAPDFMRKDAEGKVDTVLLQQALKDKIQKTGTFYVTQGFICTDHEGNRDNLGRGGSDYSAALIGAAIGADEVQIWTDIDGMHNNDPRFVENTYPIHRMSFDEAAELAYFGAKILHPATIQPCKDQGIAVLLKNTMDPQAEGTRISDAEDDSHDFHAVAAKDGITVIRIYSTRMLMAYGFLRKVFEVFEQHRTPIDMITTSEVAVSLTIDSDCHLDEIVAELKSLGKIEIERDNTIVCLVGCLDHNRQGLAASIMEGVCGVPLKMISYGASHRSIAMLVETRYKRAILQNLNDTLFSNHSETQTDNYA